MDEVYRFLDELYKLVEELRLESLDNEYSEAEQKKLKKASRKLRDVWLQLRIAIFDGTTPGFVDAKDKLDEVNAELQRAIDRLKDVEDFLELVEELLEKLNGLIAAATA